MVVLERGQQRTLVDVVAGLGLGGGGSLQVMSDQPVLASSRTYNTGEDGTFGQQIDGASPEATARAGQVVWLPQLQQNTSFRTNIGLLNTGHVAARVRIRLYDGDGHELAAPERTLVPMARLQLQEPFSRLAGRDDIDGGYASVTVESGGGIIAYASVVDNSTNDPTTVPMKY